MSKEKFNIGKNLDDSNKIDLTLQGKKDLEERLRILINELRPSVQIELSEARAQGDLSENAEYDAAKNKQGEIEAEISKIEDMLSRAKIIRNSNDKSVVHIGSTVKYKKGSTESQVTIVPEAEFDPFSEITKIGTNSTFARCVLGSKVGDIINITTNKPYKITILKIL